MNCEHFERYEKHYAETGDSLVNGTVPDSWKILAVYPIHKGERWTLLHSPDRYLFYRCSRG